MLIKSNQINLKKISKKESIDEEIKELLQEITSTSGSIKYPENITIKNYFYFLMFPTFVYELEYPRNEQFF